MATILLLNPNILCKLTLINPNTLCNLTLINPNTLCKLTLINPNTLCKLTLINPNILCKLTSWIQLKYIINPSIISYIYINNDPSDLFINNPNNDLNTIQSTKFNINLFTIVNLTRKIPLFHSILWFNSVRVT